MLLRRVNSCLAAFSALLLPAVAQIPAFPGAEGFGGRATGGRGGDVYVVTNLNSSGAGSLYHGLTTIPAAGRTIVFAVSGQIHLAGGIATRITANKLTVAGQTAPGDGILLKDGTLRISGDDIVIRHLRFRHGRNGSGGDCIDLDSGCQNVVLDHLSLTFSTDENISSFGSPPENLTLQWSLNGWGLESHSCGGLWDQNHATCHHSLWAHNHTRNPKARPNGLLEWINNVTFDWDIGFIMGDSATPAAWKANVRNSYFLCPPGNIRSKALEKANLDRNGNPNFSLYLDNCRHDSNANGLLDGTDKGYAIASGSFLQLTAPVANTGSVPVTMDDPTVAFKKIVSNAGPLRLDAGYTGPLRDEVDTRMISNLVSQTPNHIHRESDLVGVSNGGFGTLAPAAAPVDTDLDGMPDYYETALGWNPAAQDHNTALASSGGLLTGVTFFPTGTVAGYTRLEEYLHFLSIPHGTVPKNLSGTPTSIQVDLRKFTAGFADSPVFTVSNVTNGTTTQAGPGNHLVTFTPTPNQTGRGRFDFTVTDAAGSAWTQTFALLISPSGLPRNLNWQGDGSTNVWDFSAENWRRNGSPTVFSSGDRVAFDDAGSRSPALALTGTLAAATVDVNAAGNYTFGGTGAVTSTGALTKRGGGTLTLANSGANGFASVALEAGGILAGQTNSLGSGPVVFGDASLGLPGGGGTFGNPLVIQGEASLNWTSNSNMYFNSAVAGAGRLNLGFSNRLFTLGGSWVDFTGVLDTGGSTGTLRINHPDALDFSQATVILGTASLKHHLTFAANLSFGALHSSPGSYLSGGDTAQTVTDTLTIGGLNTDSTVAGAIVNGYGSGRALGLTKIGSGMLALEGANTYTGPTAVESGTLLVGGSLGATAVTVASGATLAGGGRLGGLVTMTSGSTLSPGAGPGEAENLTTDAGLTFSGSVTLPFDLGNSTTGSNDRITVSAGTLTLSGATLGFQIHPTSGALASGTYHLIDGAATMAANPAPALVLTGLPAGSRQSFSLTRQASGGSPAFVNLVVGGPPPAALVWTGSNGGGLWDLNTTGNFTGGPTTTFYNSDSVTFNDSSQVGTVILSGSLEPGTVTVANTTRAYTFSGTGELSGRAALVKTGTGTLTMASANSHAGGTRIGAGGTIQLANDTANAGALGTGPVTFLGGSLNMYRNANSYNSATYQLVVPTGQTGTFNTDDRCDLYGTLSGGGTLNLRIPWVRTTLFGDWSAFGGRINVTASTANTGEFRIGTNYAPACLPDAAVNLGPNTALKLTGILSTGAGTSFQIGELGGAASAALLGGPTGGRALTYIIGGKGTSAEFAGFIGEQSPGSTLTNIVKTGAGRWTLSGTGAWAGGTTVGEGTLVISGDVTSAGAVNIAGGASLVLAGGELSSDSVNVDDGAVFTGNGRVTADVIAAGTLETPGFSAGTPGTLEVQGSLFLGASATLRMRGGVLSDQLSVSGDLALDGTLEVSLAPDTPPGRYPLITCDGALTGWFARVILPGGVPVRLSALVPGRVDLVIDDTVAYYRFEEGTAGSQVPQGFSNAVVDSGDGDNPMNAWDVNTAPVYRAVVPFGFVPANGSANTLSLSLDGGDDVYTATSGTLRTTVFGDFTVEASVRFSSLAGWQTIVGRDDQLGSATGQNGIPQALFYLSKSGDDNHFRVELTKAGGGQCVVESTAIATPNTWYHLAAVGNMADGTLRLFVNGTPAGATTGFTGLFDPPDDSAWTIGRGSYAGAVADQVTGWIDEVRFSAVALAPGRFLSDPDPAGDSDHDGLPDSWELANFGDLAEDADGDPAHDGTRNLVEYRLGLGPADGSSAFRATCAGKSLTWPSAPDLVFTVKRSTTLHADDWRIVATVVGGPGGTTSFTDPESFAKAFYRIEFTP